MILDLLSSTFIVGVAMIMIGIPVWSFKTKHPRNGKQERLSMEVDNICKDIDDTLDKIWDLDSNGEIPDDILQELTRGNPHLVSSRDDFSGDIDPRSLDLLIEKNYQYDSCIS